MHWIRFTVDPNPRMHTVRTYCFGYPYPSVMTIQQINSHLVTIDTHPLHVPSYPWWQTHEGLWGNVSCRWAQDQCNRPRNGRYSSNGCSIQLGCTLEQQCIVGSHYNHVASTVQNDKIFHTLSHEAQLCCLCVHFKVCVHESP